MKIASSGTESGIIDLLKKFYIGSTITIVDGVVHNSKGPIRGGSLVFKKGKYTYSVT